MAGVALRAEDSVPQSKVWMHLLPLLPQVAGYKPVLAGKPHGLVIDLSTGMPFIGVMPSETENVKNRIGRR